MKATSRACRGLAVALMVLLPGLDAAGEPPIQRFPGAQPGMARAVRVDDAPLAHTTMLLGWNAEGRVSGDAATQARQALRHAEAALGAVGSSLAQGVKVHVYLARDDDAAAVDAVLGEVFRATPIAVANVTTPLPDQAARVGLDVVARAGVGSGTGVRIATVPGLPKPPAGAHVGVLPAGRRVFFSGQAERDASLAGGTRKSMESLGRTIEWMKLRKADVVQVKAFIRPYGDLAAAAAEIARFFAPEPVPPVVFVEWIHPGIPAEIEMVLAGRSDAPAEPDGVAFLTPPGMTASPRFARIAVVGPGHPLIYIAGLYGETAGTGRREWTEIFSQLGDILWATGSSMRHQVKGTYYSSTAESRRLHGEIRDVFLDPARPPASSGMMTHGTGRPGRESTIDMIAVPVPGRPTPR